MNKNKLKTGFELYKEEVKGHKWTFAVYVILRSLVVAIGVVSFFRGYPPIWVLYHITRHIARQKYSKFLVHFDE